MDEEGGLLSFSAGVVILLIFTLSLYYTLRRRQSAGKLPPQYSGWIPWLGCAIEFGVSPLDFIEAKRKELGPVYTLYVAGERLTFLTDPEDFAHFFQSSNVDFQKAVQNPVQNVASVSERSFFLYHTKIHDMVKGRLASSRLDYFSPKLQKEFQKQFDQLGAGGACDLLSLVRNSMYAAVMNNLFGDNVLPTSEQEKFLLTTKHFVTFDEQFEYGARLSPLFLKEWSVAKQYLLTLFRNVVKNLGKEEKPPQSETLLETLIGMVDSQHAANYGLLLLWASLANAVPLTFWTLVYIHAHPDVLAKLRQQVDAAVKEQIQPDGKVLYNEELFQRIPYLKWNVLEAIMLQPAGIITRRVTRSFKVKDLTIPAGDMLMLSPFWAHRNPRYFKDPSSFNPDRWKNAELEKNLFLEGFVAFGGGRYQCPGRWYALMEIQMYVAMFIWRFDCKLENNQVPKYSGKHLVGTQQPLEPCPAQISLRQH